jgi:hypothetical protein
VAVKAVLLVGEFLSFANDVSQWALAAVFGYGEILWPTAHISKIKLKGST